MANWKTYGAGVVVSAGVMLTGVLWLDRPSPYIAAEDLVELTAAVNERITVAYWTGTNNPSFSSNVITSFVEWKGLYDDVLVRARAMATNTPADIPAILWLDASVPAPQDGDTIAYSDAGWTLQSITTIELDEMVPGQPPQLIYNYAQTTLSNSYDAIPTTATRTGENAAKFYWPLMNPVCFPLGSLVFPYTTSTNLTAEWDHGNWWDRIGNGTNVYKYGCEKWHGTEGEELLITLVGGIGHVLLANSLTISPADTTFHPVGVRNVAVTANAIFSSLYRVDAENRKSVYFAVTDESTFPVIQLTLSATKLEVDAGGDTTFTVRPKSEIFSQRIMTFSAVGGVSVSPSAAIFTTNNWETPVTITVAASEMEDHGDSAALVDIGYGTEHNFLAVKINNGGMATKGIKTSAQVYDVYKAQSVNAQIGLADEATNIYITARHIITTNSLNEARNVLTNMTRTMCILPYSSLAFTNATRHWPSGRVDWEAIGDEDAIIPIPDIPLDELEDEILSIAASFTNQETVVSFGDPNRWRGDLIDVSLRMNAAEEVSFRYVYDPEDWYDHTYYSLSDWSHMFANAYVLHGASLPYPSRYACESGYVSRVSIYAAIFPMTGNEPLTGFNFGLGEADEIDASGSVHKPEDLNGYGLGLTDHLCPFPSIPGFDDSVSANKASQYTLDTDTPGVKEIRLTLLGSWDNPTSVPVFDVGTTNIVFPADCFRRQMTEVTYLSASNYASFETILTRYRSYFSAWLCVSHFIVVVDWNWKHMNPSAPFVPVPHTPEWILANTNAP